MSLFAAPVDRLARPLRNLRLSVTDRCNLRCSYCMPEERYGWLPSPEILSFEEICALVDVFAALGVERVRLTGGEPLVRHELPKLVRMLAVRPAIKDLALTTNGTLLAGQARALREAGLHRVTVSLDTLRPDRFFALTRRDDHERVLEGIEAAAEAGFCGLKLDAVIVKGVNDDELDALLDYGREVGAEVRFIEYMDVGGATRWSPKQVLTRGAMLERIARSRGPIEAVGEPGAATAERFRLRDGTVFGIIASTTAPFCRACDRSRLTADGRWFRCLYATDGTDLKGPLRRGDSPGQLAKLVAAAWEDRSDRGAETRLATRGRGALLGAKDLRDDPHLEMHTRGG